MASIDLTKGPVGAQLTRMTIPYFLGVSSMILASMIETIYIGILGAKELAAYSFMFPVIMALTSISMGVGVGASSLIARAEGEGDRIGVSVLATHTIFLTVFLTLFLSGSTYFFLEFFYEAMGAKGEVLELVVAYAEIWIVFGLLSFTIPMVSSAVLRALGIAKVPGYIMTLTSGLQLIVSPILIFGFFGVPALGLLGSAYAFLIIGFVRVIAFSILVVSENILLKKQILKGWMTSAQSIMRIALPSMLSSLIGPISIGITIALLASHGDVIVAAFGVVSRIEMLVTMILGALASSVAPFVGQNWGAKRDERIREGLSVAYRFCIFWGVLCFIFLGLFGEMLVDLINDDKQFVEAAGWFLMIVPISFGLMGVGQVAASVFIALGKPIPPTVLAIVRSVVVYIPMAYVFNSYWGFVGIFVALMLANVLFGGVAYLWGGSMLRKEFRIRA